jgi:ABC-type microcin C transport system permease subunit YejE
MNIQVIKIIAIIQTSMPVLYLLIIIIIIIVAEVIIIAIAIIYLP